MSSRATKFFSRAPRYTLSPSDNRFLRYARQSEHGRTHTTRFLDISQSGLAFVTDAEHAPHYGDLIKLEIPLSDTETVAWWGRVVRIEEYASHKWYMKREDFNGENQILVAITFHELPEGHAQLIRQTLARKFEEVRAVESRRRLASLATFAVTRAWKILLYTIAIAAAVYALHYISMPSSTYDSDKGAPWGERFEWLQIKPKPETK